MSVETQGIEADFARYRERGDTAALARVFDALAPDLILVAGHFARGRLEAEDLVQQTFVKAIRGADSWDAQRPLRPWFVGILVNEARMEHRRAARSLDPERLQTRVVDDPHDVAADREFAETVLRKIEKLPEKYRHVLTLRYVHGLTPREIAHSLGRSPETVKTWLRRGRTLLRKVLPAGFAASLQALVSSQRSLASVRTSVLEASKTTPQVELPEPEALGMPRVDAQATNAALPSSTLAFALVALSLGALGTWWLWRTPSSPSGDNPPLAEDQGARVADTNAELGRREAASASEPSRPMRVLVLWPDGSPAAGVQVRARPRDRTNAALHERWGRVGRDGALAFAEDEPLASGTWSLRPDRGRSQDLRFPLSRPHSIQLAAGLEIRGRVVDKTSEQGIPNARVWLSSGERFDVGRVVTRTDANGRYRIRAVPPGRALSVRADAYGASSLRRIHAPTDPGTTDHVQDFKLAPGDRIVEGRVRSQDGEAIADARLWIGHVFRRPNDFEASAGKHQAPILTRTDDDGRFRVRALRQYRRHVLWAAAPGFGLARHRLGMGKKAGPGAPLEIVLARASTLEGRSEPGTKIRLAFEAYKPGSEPAEATDHDVLPPWVATTTTADEGGAYRLEDLPSGRLRAFAIGADPRQQAATDLTLFAARTSNWSPRLGPAPSLRGILRSKADQALESLQVVARTWGQAPRRTTSRSDGSFELPSVPEVPHEVRIYADRDREILLAQRSGVQPAHGTMRIVVPEHRLPSASLRGRFRIDALLPALASARPRDFVVSARSQVDALQVALDAQGGFAFPALPPGAYRVAVSHRGDLIWTSTHELRARQDLDLGEVFASKTSGDLTLFVRRADGTAIERGFAFLMTPDGLSTARMLWLRKGEGRARALPIGRYRIVIGVDGARCFGPVFEIRPGAQLNRRFVVPARAPQRFSLVSARSGNKLRGFVTIKGADGETAAAFDFFQKRDASGSFPQTVFLAPGDYELTFTPHEGSGAIFPAVSFRIRIPPEKASPSLRLDLDDAAAASRRRR